MYIHAGLAQQTGQQGNQGNTDQGNPSSRNKLLNALRLCARLR